MTYKDPYISGPRLRKNEAGEEELYWICTNCGHTETTDELEYGCPNLECTMELIG